MTRDSIVERLHSGEVLLLDGGTGSELQRRGADVLKEAEDRLKAWSATANIEYAEVVRQVHSDYLRVGADILISNNFWTTPTRLERIGERDNWRTYATAAIRNAVQARDAMRREAYVAGGIAAPSLQGGFQPPPNPALRHATAWRRGVPEGVGRPREAAGRRRGGRDASRVRGFHRGLRRVAVDGCAEAGLPVFLGVRHIASDGAMQYGRESGRPRPRARGPPCRCRAAHVQQPGEHLRGASHPPGGVRRSPFGAYPNLGYNPTGPIANMPMLTNQKPSTGEDILQNAGYYPSLMAQFAAEWKGMGAQIIGGCCASGPEHIMAMRPVVKGC